MYERGARVLVSGHGGREAILRVWDDLGNAVALSSEAGYARLLDGDVDAPLVGFPRRDVQGLATSPTAPPPPSEQSLPDAQD